MMFVPSTEPTGLFEQPGKRLFQLERFSTGLDVEVKVSKEEMRPKVLAEVKQTELADIPDHKLEISFDSPEGDDILIKKLDPENALGYRTFQSESDYFNQIGAELYQPSAAELGLDG